MSLELCFLVFFFFFRFLLFFPNLSFASVAECRGPELRHVSSGVMHEEK